MLKLLLKLNQPQNCTKPKSITGTTKTDKEQTSVQLNSYLQNEIARLAEMYGRVRLFLKHLLFVIENYEKRANHQTSSSFDSQLKSSNNIIYQQFSVKTLQNSRVGAFKMATDGMDTNLSVRTDGKSSTTVGILPGEENQQCYGCINGINVFNYFKPWQVLI